MKQIKRILFVLNKVEEWISVLILCAMSIVVALQVFFRYFLNSPLIWTEEMSRLLFVWLIAMAAGYCVTAHEHIKVEIIVDMLPSFVQKVIQVIMLLLPLGTFLYLLPYAVEYTAKQHPLLTSAMRVPYSLTYGAVAAGSVLLIVHLLIELILVIFDKGECVEL